jgi:hypothetical protein
MNTAAISRAKPLIIPIPVDIDVFLFHKRRRIQRELIADRKSLFQGFAITGDVDAVKAIFVRIFMGHRDKNHHGGRQDREFAAD